MVWPLSIQSRPLPLLPQSPLPQVPNLARAQWLQKRTAELLPVEYFHVVFTVPQEIASVAFYNKEAV